MSKFPTAADAILILEQKVRWTLVSLSIELRSAVLQMYWYRMH